LSSLEKGSVVLKVKQTTTPLALAPAACIINIDKNQLIRFQLPRQEERMDIMSDCLFCRIISKEIPANRVYEDDHAIVINDINPQAPVHLLAIPKEHYAGVHLVGQASLFGRLYAAIKTVIEDKKLDEKGYRLVINFGEKAGQSVPHIHMHVLSGRPLHWPPG
jgi:histidine triad (HIT) family protein